MGQSTSRTLLRDRCPRCNKARELGVSGTPNGLELKMEKALRKSKIRYLSQRRYGMGIIDFYLPDGNIALFVDGGVWHADPRKFEATDILFFESNTSRKESITAADVWRKDRTHNDYLESKGYTVIRFWEKEIECEIERCIMIIRSQIQAHKIKRIKQIRSHLSYGLNNTHYYLDGD